jgi:hypothetical protein
MRRLLLGLVVLVVTTACAETPTDPTTSPITPEARIPTGATVWMADLCTIASDLRSGLWASATGTGPLRQRLRDQLDTATAKVDAALEKLAAMPGTPLEGGDTAVTQLNDELAEVRDALARSRSDLDTLPRNASDNRLGQVIGAVWPRAAARAADPFAGIAVSDAMRSAATTADCAAFSF